MTTQFHRPHDRRFVLDTLTALNMDEMLRAFRLESRRGVRQVARWGLRGLVRRIASTALEYDDRVGRDGLSAASDWLLAHVTGGYHAHGLANIPAQGPLLLLSNHPGLTDAMVIFATLRRDDLRIIAADRGILRLLPHIERYLIYVSDSDDQRMSAVRRVTQHLRAGGAVLTFPYGNIEPDPALYADAAGTLAGWSRSADLFARLLPGLPVLPVAVSGVLSPAALRNPVARLYRTRRDRDWAAASLQFLLRRYQNTTATITYGQPVPAADDVHAAVIAQMQAMVGRSAASREG